MREVVLMGDYVRELLGDAYAETVRPYVELLRSHPVGRRLKLAHEAAQKMSDAGMRPNVLLAAAVEVVTEEETA